MKILSALVLLMAGLIGPALIGPASAGSYTLENRPIVVFPGPNGGITRVSPYPAGQRAGSVWVSDACWRDCEGQCAWRMEACLREAGSEACRPHLDVCTRACQRSCRARGGPLLGFIDW